MHLTFRILTAEQKDEYLELVEKTQQTLENPLLLLPFGEEELIDTFNPELSIVYGAYNQQGKLVGASVLTLRRRYIAQIVHELKLEDYKNAEISRCMVLPEARGHNLMRSLNIELIKQAKALNVQNILATVHPDNIASDKSLQSLGLQETACINKANGFWRKVYTAKIEDLLHLSEQFSTSQRVE